MKAIGNFSGNCQKLEMDSMGDFVQIWQRFATSWNAHFCLQIHFCEESSILVAYIVFMFEILDIPIGPPGAIKWVC